MTRRQTTESPNSFEEISLMRSSLVVGWGGRRTTTPRRLNQKRQKDQNLGAAGAQEQRCGSHKSHKNKLIRALFVGMEENIHRTPEYDEIVVRIRVKPCRFVFATGIESIIYVIDSNRQGR